VPTEKAGELLAPGSIETVPTVESAAPAADAGAFSTAAEPTPEATLEAATGRSSATVTPAAETPAQEATLPAEATVEVAVADAAIAPVAEVEPPATTENTAFLLPLQIGLGLLFLLLLILWLVARRRARALSG
jgi:hypothetical protein